MFLKDWELNTAKGREAATLLDMIETIVYKAKAIEEDSILIQNNNRSLVNEINNQELTESQFTHDSGAEVSRIKEIIEE